MRYPREEVIQRATTAAKKLGLRPGEETSIPGTRTQVEAFIWPGTREYCGDIKGLAEDLWNFTN